MMSSAKEKAEERAEYLKSKGELLHSLPDVPPTKHETPEKLISDRRPTRDVPASTTVLGTVTIPKTSTTTTTITTATPDISDVTKELTVKHAADFKKQQFDRIVKTFLERHPPKAGTNLVDYLRVNIPRYVEQIKKRQAQKKEMTPASSGSTTTIVPPTTAPAIASTTKTSTAST